MYLSQQLLCPVVILSRTVAASVGWEESLAAATCIVGCDVPEAGVAIKIPPHPPYSVVAVSDTFFTSRPSGRLVVVRQL